MPHALAIASAVFSGFGEKKTSAGLLCKLHRFGSLQKYAFAEKDLTTLHASNCNSDRCNNA